jgi:hypothetical protein
MRRASSIRHADSSATSGRDASRAEPGAQRAGGERSRITFSRDFNRLAGSETSCTTAGERSEAKDVDTPSSVSTNLRGVWSGGSGFSFGSRRECNYLSPTRIGVSSPVFRARSDNSCALNRSTQRSDGIPLLGNGSPASFAADGSAGEPCGSGLLANRWTGPCVSGSTGEGGGVLVRSALPRAPRIAEVDLDVRGDRELLVRRHLQPAIPGQGSPQLRRKASDLSGEGLHDGLRIFARHLHQHREPGLALDQCRDVRVV